MTIYHLFATHGFDPSAQDWYPIFTGINGTQRTLINVREDWRFRGRGARSKMYEREIEVPQNRYTARQRQISDQSIADIDAVARHLNIGLPSRQLPANTLAVASTSTLLTAIGSSTATAQQRQGAQNPKKRKASVANPAQRPSSPSKKKASSLPKTGVTSSRRTLKAVNYNESEESSAEEFEDDEDENDAPGSTGDRVSDDVQKGTDEDSDGSCIKIANRERPDSSKSESDSDDSGRSEESRSQEDDSDVEMNDFHESSDEAESNGGETSNAEDLMEIDAAGDPYQQSTVVRQPPILQHGPVAQSLTPPQTPEEILTENRPGYQQWRTMNLDRILLDEPLNRFPKPPTDPDPEPEDEEPVPHIPEVPSAHDRLARFFAHMFGEDHGIQIERAISREAASDQSDLQLQRIATLLVNRYGLAPDFRLDQAFGISDGPFPNFMLPTAAHSRGLQMFHRSDVDFTGPGKRVVAVFNKRTDKTLTREDTDFVDREDSAFKRGGRVYTVEVHQPGMAILGEERAFNTASVTFDVMLCDAHACTKCSPDGVVDFSPASGLPRVHFRHLGLNKRFIQKDPYLYGPDNEDTGDEFPDEAPALPDEVEFWDGSKQAVITCIGGRCKVCFDARRDDSHKKVCTTHFKPTMEQFRPYFSKPSPERKPKKKGGRRKKKAAKPKKKSGGTKKNAG